MACKTPEEIAAEQAAAAAEKKSEEEAAYIADMKRKRGEDDTTNINIVPIEVTGEVSVDLEGLFFNQQAGFTSDDVPKKELTIEKDVLDRSSQMFVGRFQYKIPARSKIVFRASLDGFTLDEEDSEFGTNLPYMSGEGYVDPVLIKYPSSARANRDGRHKLVVEYGVITGITESQIGLLTWGKLQATKVSEFTITLLPHKITD